MKTCNQSLRAVLFAFLFLLSSSVWATHINGGYITYKWLQRNQYEIIVGIFHDIGGVPLSPQQQVMISGLEFQQVDLPLRAYLNPNPGSQRGIGLYTGIYTFPEVSYFGGIRYRMSVRIENRSRGIVNMASPSDQISFYIETEVYVNSFLGVNSASMPTDTINYVIRKVNENVNIDLSSTDPDGDSLVYKLIAPLKALGREIEMYRSPEQVQPCEGCTFVLNSQTGQLTWNRPVLQGSFAVAVMVEEWRKIPGTSKSLRMGYTIKDILLIVTD